MFWSDKTRAALSLAYHLHDGQADKAGVPYIFHPYRVAEKMELYRQYDVERLTIVALLHDCVEDTALTLDGLHEAALKLCFDLDDEVLATIDSVTRKDGELYEDFIMRAKANPLGHWVKLEDVRDNQNRDRMPGVPSVSLVARYDSAYNELIK